MEGAVRTNLFFNDPWSAQVISHQRKPERERPPLAGVVVGGLGVVALGVVAGALSHHGSPADDGGVAMPAVVPAQINAPLRVGSAPAPPPPKRSRKKPDEKLRLAEEKPEEQEEKAGRHRAPESAAVTETPAVTESPEPTDEPEEEPTRHDKWWRHGG